jgi:hypothetical protein
LLKGENEAFDDDGCTLEKSLLHVNHMQRTE